MTTMKAFNPFLFREFTVSLLSPSTQPFLFSLMKWLSCPNAKYSDRLLVASHVHAVLRRIAILVIFFKPEDSLPPTCLVYLQFIESKSTYFLHYLVFTNHIEGYSLLMTALPLSYFPSLRQV